MPFEPLNEEEKKFWERPSCQHPGHLPPRHVVITRLMKWRCPACGFTSFVAPNHGNTLQHQIVPVDKSLPQ